MSADLARAVDDVVAQLRRQAMDAERARREYAPSGKHLYAMACGRLEAFCEALALVAGGNAEDHRRALERAA